MTVGAVTPGLRIMPADIPASAPASGKQPEISFGEQLRTAVADVDAQQSEATYKVNGLFEGNDTDVHEAMIAVQKADLSFQLMLQVRNKVVQAYQEIERMQF